ncbi:MAG: hypothetical protein OXI90_02685 [Gammaproteobacteria bacterium]|nr:hypothetical protein [Gammaproteobacteria bacterium]
MKYIASVCAILWAATASAQNLTKTEEGRAAIGLCYSACFQRDNEAATELASQIRRLNDFFASDLYAATDFDAWNAVARDEYVLLCGLMVRQYSVAKGCHYGCDDLEKAYGTTTATARSKFHSRIRHLRELLKRQDLWNESANAPAEDIEQICGAKWDAAGSSGRTEVQRALPNLTR